MLVSVVNASVELDVHPNTVRRLITSGKLPVVRIGRRVLIRRDSLERFVKRVEGTEKRGHPR